MRKQPVRPNYLILPSRNSTCLRATGSYFFSARGAFRTDVVYSINVSLQYEILIRGARLFIKGDTLNVFNNTAVIFPGTDVFDRFNSGAASGLRAFNPFTEVPVEGVHYLLSPTFGKPTGPESYQTRGHSRLPLECISSLFHDLSDVLRISR